MFYGYPSLGAADPQEDTMERKKLLIADDSEMNRAILANMLEQDFEIMDHEVEDNADILTAHGVWAHTVAFDETWAVDGIEQSDDGAVEAFDVAHLE